MRADGSGGGRDPLGDKTDGSSRRLVVTAGWPSGARLFASLVIAAGLASIGFTVVFGIATAREAGSALTVLGVALSMMVFWAPVTLWSSWYVAMPVILVSTAGLAMVSHRYRARAWGSRWRRVGRVCLVLVLICGAWTLLLGVVGLVYVVSSG